MTVEDKATVNPQSHEYYFNSSWFKTQQVTSDILAIREPYHYEDVLSFFVQAGDDTYMVDTGMGLSDIRTQFPSEEPYVLLTHTHWDHVGAVSELKRAAVFDHPFETDRLKKGWMPHEMVGFEEENFDSQHKPPPEFSKETFTLPGTSDFSTFSDGQVLTVGDTRIAVIHTPGHSPGSVCFFDETRGLLFTGDTIYKGPIYLHMKESNPDEYFASLEKLYSQLKGKIDRILPGHNRFSSSPELLERFFSAARGTLKPLEIEKGVDEFGSYIWKKWEEFSFKLPVN